MPSETTPTVRCLFMELMMDLLPTSIHPARVWKRTPGALKTMLAALPVKGIRRTSFMAAMESRAPTGITPCGPPEPMKALVLASFTNASSATHTTLYDEYLYRQAITKLVHSGLRGFGSGTTIAAARSSVNAA